MASFDAVVVGGGPAGLAVAACLQRAGATAVVLERGDTVAPAWHRHYERLHLHTNKSASGLPHRPMPAGYPRYPSRDQVAEYLTQYAAAEDIDVRLGTEVNGIARNGDGWLATTPGETFTAPNVVVATGLSNTPWMPGVPGMEGYRGEILHTAAYRNGESYRGRRVLVVGFGNSAGEIALDLAEHGATPHISVRSKSVVVPRDIAGIPILTIARALSVLPPKVADVLSRPLLRVLVGDVAKVGIPAAEWGPMEQIATSGKIPLLDVGTMAALERGEIVARPGLERFTETGVTFTDGTTGDYDAVVFGTGYTPAAGRLFADDDAARVLGDNGCPVSSGGPTALAGLYFCGFHEPPTGRLREIGIEARRIATLIAPGRD